MNHLNVGPCPSVCLQSRPLGVSDYSAPYSGERELFCKGRNNRRVASEPSKRNVEDIDARVWVRYREHWYSFFVDLRLRGWGIDPALANT